MKGQQLVAAQQESVPLEVYQGEVQLMEDAFSWNSQSTTREAVRSAHRSLGVTEAMLREFQVPQMLERAVFRQKRELEKTRVVEQHRISKVKETPSEVSSSHLGAQ